MPRPSSIARARPTRRHFLELAVAAGAIGLSSFSPFRYGPVTDASLDQFFPAVRELQAMLRSHVRGWFDAGKLVREDGYVYAVDVNQLMINAVDVNDRVAYDKLRGFAVSELLSNDASDPLTQGFVLWRHKAGMPLDASGTTEGLRLAKGLWRGAKVFRRPGDADLAVMIIRGYGRHAGIDHDIWLIRNYFSFTTRSFATNSFLVDYDPDFIQEVADASADAEMKDLAAKSYYTVRSSLAPCGLIYDLIQPEVQTLTPNLKLFAFSPNDIIQVSNSCSVALTVTRGEPKVASKTLDFVLSRLSDPRLYYFGRTGGIAHPQKAEMCEFTVFARLAAELHRRADTALLLQRVVPQWADFCKNPRGVSLAWVAGEILASMKAVLDLQR